MLNLKAWQEICQSQTCSFHGNTHFTCNPGILGPSYSRMLHYPISALLSHLSQKLNVWRKNVPYKVAQLIKTLLHSYPKLHNCPISVQLTNYLTTKGLTEKVCPYKIAQLIEIHCVDFVPALYDDLIKKVSISGQLTIIANQLTQLCQKLKVWQKPCSLQNTKLFSSWKHTL